MSRMSDHDRRLAEPPRDRFSDGECTRCHSTEGWDDNEECVECGGDAIRYRYDPCSGCGAETAWQCTCDDEGRVFVHEDDGDY